MKKPAIYSLNEIKSQDVTFSSISADYSKIKAAVALAFADELDQVIFIGCGSSYYLAASVYSYFIEHCDIPALFLPCFELNLNCDKYIRNRKTLIVPFTRSSSTTEVRSAIDKCHSFSNVKSLAISCDQGSAEYNDYVILCNNSEEQSIVMTRSFTGLLYAGMLMSKAACGVDDLDLLKLGEQCRADIAAAESVAKDIVPYICNKKLVISLGQGCLYGIAGETSIKIKEMCLLPTEVYFTMEYRHGPISIANSDSLFFLYSNPATSDFDIKLATELKALGSTIISIGFELDSDLIDISDYHFELSSNYLPLAILLAQFIGVYWALEKNIDPDEPKNLSKAIIL